MICNDVIGLIRMHFLKIIHIFKREIPRTPHWEKGFVKHF